MKVKPWIKLRIGPKGIIYGMLFFVCIMNLLQSMGVPHAIAYILDVMNLLLLFYLIRGKLINKCTKNPLISIQLFVFCVGIVVSIVQWVSPLLVFWALRNNTRFLIFALACIEYLDKSDISNIFRMFHFLFYINFLVMTIQFGVLGFTGDYLGGIFGTEKGANSYLNIFLIIMSAKVIIDWMNKKANLTSLLLMIAISIYECAIAEIKVYFVELILLIIICFFVSCSVNRKATLIFKGVFFFCVGVVAIGVGLRVLYILFPNFANFFTIDNMIRIVTDERGYSNSGDLNRFTAIIQINQTIPEFSENLIKVFGMGLGSTEFSSSFDFLTSQFYREYNYLHYSWFSMPWLYLECGYVGMIGYLLSFLISGIQGIKIGLKNRNNLSVLVAVVVCFIMPLIFIYNQSARLESAYLLYFCVSMIYIGGIKIENKGNTVGKYYSTGV